MSAAGQDQRMRREKAAGPEAATDFSWRMPGGEDLLRFALSAGLVAGARWLETRPEAAAPDRSEDPCTLRAGTGGKK